MKSCQVDFEDGMSDDQIADLVAIIEKFQGVQRVKLRDPNGKIGLKHQHTPAASHDKGADNFAAMSDDYLANIAMDEIEKQSTNHRAGSFQGAPHQQSPTYQTNKPMADSLGTEKNTTPRYAISYALKWGILNKKIQPNALKDMGPEQLIQVAMGLISQMPEEEKKKLGKQLSDMGINEE